MNKTLKFLSGLIFVSSLAACGSSSSKDSPTVQIYPEARDTAESGDGDNTEQNATPITLNTSYTKTLFPVLDVDWVSVELQAGIEYEFSANKLCATCDTKIYVYQADEESESGYIELSSNDDFIELDSAIVYTPVETATYLVKVIPYDEDMGISTYTLNVHEFIDEDGDNYSSFYDCNDDDNTIAPRAEELAEDGVDQDCNGSDLIADDSEDAFESDNTSEQASEIAFLEYGYTEAVFIFQQFANEVHTIHDADDIDWIKFDLPAYSAADVYIDYTNFNGLITIFESDAETEVANGFDTVLNNTAVSKTFYIKLESDGGSIGYYLPTAIFYGYDKDQDGFYTMQWSGGRDCNDDNFEINPQAADLAGDGIDSNCDGLDIDAEAEQAIF